MKRTSAVLLCLSLLSIAGVLFTSNHSPTQPPIAKKVTQWEYKFVLGLDLIDDKDKGVDYLESAVKGLNKLGDEGWELAAKDGTHYIFKRLK